jgi:hypothetical protein
LGVQAAVAAPLLSDLIGTPPSVLIPIGLFLIAYGVAVWVIGTRAVISSTAVWAALFADLQFMGLRPVRAA